jgi:hypothetical protein
MMKSFFRTMLCASALGLLTCSAYAQAPAAPASFPSTLATTFTSINSAVTGYNAAITTTAATVVAAGSKNRLSYQLQGSGYACMSFATATITISANASTAVCTGLGAFLVTAGSVSNYNGQIVPNTALTAIGATGSTLTIVGESQ